MCNLQNASKAHYKGFIKVNHLSAVLVEKVIREEFRVSSKRKSPSIISTLRLFKSESIFS
jgi:hypothetical protein